jgi:hypothetical protein
MDTTFGRLEDGSCYEDPAHSLDPGAHRTNPTSTTSIWPASRSLWRAHGELQQAGESGTKLELLDSACFHLTFFFPLVSFLQILLEPLPSPDLARW